MTRTRFLSAVVLMTFTGHAAVADDLFPPPWRFNPGTTVQHWDFSGGPIGGAPDALPLNTPFGTPIMVPTTGTNWLPTLAGRNDVWDITGGSLQFDIPNAGNQLHLKNIQIQVTYLGVAPAPGPNYVVSGPNGLFSQVGGPLITPLPGGWIHEITNWTIAVCPPFERITIAPSLVGVQMILDQVVIDTECIVPSPASATLLAMSGLCVWRRRRC